MDVDQTTIDKALLLLTQYRDQLVASHAPISLDGTPEPRTLAQSSDPLEIAALEDITALDAVIYAMSHQNPKDTKGHFSKLKVEASDLASHPPKV